MKTLYFIEDSLILQMFMAMTLKQLNEIFLNIMLKVLAAG